MVEGRERFVDKVKAWRAAYHFQGTPSYIVSKNLAALDLKKWNETEFGNVTVKKQHPRSNLNALDVRRETHPLTTKENLEQV